MSAPKKTILTFRKGVLVGGLATLALAQVGSSEQVKPFVNAMSAKFKELSSLLPNLKSHPKETVASLMKHGAPMHTSDLYLYEDHALLYNNTARQPYWVAEHLTSQKVKGPADKSTCHFKVDRRIDKMFRVHANEFKGSGYSRGHMSPALDHAYSQDAMEDSFLMSNMVPQDKDNNKHFWCNFEVYCRRLTNTFKDVYVVSGPLYLPNEFSAGKKLIKHEVVGENGVWVPTHLFKVIVAEQPDTGTKMLGAFIIPNKPLSFDRKLCEFEVKIEEVESKSGFHIFPQLDREKCKNLCSEEGCALLSRDELASYFAMRRLQWAKDLEKLEDVWAKFEEKKLKPTDELLEVYKYQRAKLLELTEDKVKVLTTKTPR